MRLKVAVAFSAAVLLAQGAYGSEGLSGVRPEIMHKAEHWVESVRLGRAAACFDLGEAAASLDPKGDWNVEIKGMEIVLRLLDTYCKVPEEADD